MKGKLKREEIQMFGTGAQLSREAYALYDRKNCPAETKEAQVRARYWQERNPYLQTFQDIDISFYHYGFAIRPASGEKPSNKFKNWREENEDEINPYALSVWKEWRTLEAVVSYWRDGMPPITLDPERCRYSDDMGIQTLEYEHRLTPAQVAQLRTPAERKAFAQSTHKIGTLPGEEFKVLKAARTGAGFGKPRMYSIFRALGQFESTEVSEALMAFFGRLIERRHLMGYEPKSSNSGQSNLKYRMFREDRWKSMKTFYKDLCGAVETGSNFDHKTVFVHPPVEFFDDKKWEGIQRRLIWWSGPVGWMLIARGMTPFLMEIFEQMAGYQRKLVGAHLNKVINEGWNPPEPVKVCWSNRCFKDARMALDMLKWGVQQGPVSLTTALEQGGFDPAEESERKLAESKAPAAALLPLFDQAHGNSAKGKAAAGRPPGTKDGDPTPGAH